jgi:hypothetical protein
METPEAYTARLARLEKELDDINDYAAVRERGLRNERDIRDLRGDLAGDIEGVRGEVSKVRDDVTTLTRTILSATITLALSTAAIIGTLLAIFRG